MLKKNLYPYIELIRSFLSGKITANDFQLKYLNLFKKDNTHFEENEFMILDQLFAWVDAYCEDSELRDKNDCDEETLLIEAKKSLEKLNALK